MNTPIISIDLVKLTGYDGKLEDTLIFSNSNDLSCNFVYRESFGHFDLLRDNPEIFISLLISLKDRYGTPNSSVTDMIDVGEFWLNGEKVKITEKSLDPKNYNIFKYTLSVGKEKRVTYTEQYILSRFDLEKEIMLLKLKIFKKKDEFLGKTVFDYYDNMRTEDILEKYYDEIV